MYGTMSRSATPTRIGDFELITKLGEGGMGAVYKARQVMLDRVVALKVLPPKLARDAEFAQRFMREARATAKLNHPNIVSGIDVGQADGYFYFAMELVEGETLKQRFDRTGPLSEKEAARIGAAIASALAHAHASDLIHRDVKPENILLARDETPKLADLGLAKDALEGDASLTATGMALGTPNYIAPEQAEGSRKIDGRADIYSLGCTLYHVLTGHTPFDGTSPAVVMLKHLRDKIAHPQSRRAELSDDFCAVLERMLARAKEDRYPSMAAAQVHLEALAAGEPLNLAPLPAAQSNFSGGPKKAALTRMSRAQGKATRDDHEEHPHSRRSDSQVKARGVSPMAVLLGVGVLMTVLALYFVLRKDNSSSAQNPAPPTTPSGTPPATPQTSVSPSIPSVRPAPPPVAPPPAPPQPPLPNPVQPPPPPPVRAEWKPIFDHSNDFLDPSCKVAWEYRDGAIWLVPKAPNQAAKTLAEFDDAEIRFRFEPKNLDDAYFAVRLGNGANSQIVFNTVQLRKLEGQANELIFTCAGPKVTATLNGNPIEVDARGARARGALQFNAHGQCLKLTALDYRPLPPQGQALAPAAFDPEKSTPEQIVMYLRQKLTEANPGPRSEEITYKESKGKLIELTIPIATVHDITPLQALKELKELKYLHLQGAQKRRSELSDISPLQGVALEYLELTFCKVSDVTPLLNMPLKTLHLTGTQINDLAPLKTLKLERLSVGCTQIADLKPLEEMRTLNWLAINSTQITDLSPLKKLPLVVLNMCENKISDLAPLKGLALRECYLDANPVTDFSPLYEMPLKNIVLQDPRAQIGWLKNIKTLEFINNQPAGEILGK